MKLVLNSYDICDLKHKEKIVAETQCETWLHKEAEGAAGRAVQTCEHVHGGDAVETLPCLLCSELGDSL